MLAKRTGKGRVAVANPEVERELALLQSRSGSPAAVQALAAAIEERDNYTHEHSQQLVRLARGVSMMLGLARRARRADRPRRAAARRRQARHARGAPREERPAHARRVGGHVRAPDRRRAHPRPHEGARDPRPDRAPRARALGRHRLPGRPRAPAHPGRLAGDPRLPRLRRDDDRAALPRGADRTSRRRRAARRRGSKYDPDVVDALLDLLGHDRPQVPDRAAGVKLAATPPREPVSRRSLAPDWVPGG